MIEQHWRLTTPQISVLPIELRQEKTGLLIIAAQILKMAIDLKLRILEVEVLSYSRRESKGADQLRSWFYGFDFACANV